jgi:hypothetical protein
MGELRFVSLASAAHRIRIATHSAAVAVIGSPTSSMDPAAATVLKINSRHLGAKTRVAKFGESDFSGFARTWRAYRERRNRGIPGRARAAQRSRVDLG